MTPRPRRPGPLLARPDAPPAPAETTSAPRPYATEGIQ